jgi:death-on-curing protein
MAEYVYLTVAEVEQMHRELIDEFGGSHGLRDRGALEAAVFRPQIGYYNSLAEEAATLMESLANNHPFIDGNKRIAFSAADTFLARNGFYLDVDADETYRFMIEALSGSTFRFGPILDWINANVKPLP